MRTTPYQHQARELEESWDEPARALLWQMRTGKSKVVVDTACRLYALGELSGVLVLAPNGVHHNWIERELPTHGWDEVDALGMSWSSRAARERTAETAAQAAGLLRHDGLRVLAVNSEVLVHDRAAGLIQKFVRACGGRVMGVADESHGFRTPGSRRTKRATSLFRGLPYRRILSGTSVMNSPLHAYSQFGLLAKGSLGFDTFGAFQDHFAVMRTERTNRGFGRKYPVVDGYRNLEELRERMAAWSSVVLREDCDDMPDVVEVPRAVELSDAQVAAYRSMSDDFIAEVGDEWVDAIDGGVRLLKLQQILGGFIITQDRRVVSVDDAPPRLLALMEEVQGNLPDKTIVWCRFTEDIRRVCHALGEAGISHASYHGGTSERDRAALRRDFLVASDPKVFVGQPQSAGEGLNLSSAAHIVNYSHSHDAIVREQSKERATLIGGGHIGLVDLYAPGTVEEDVLACLAGKRSVSDLVAGHGLRDLLARRRA